MRTIYAAQNRVSYIIEFLSKQVEDKVHIYKKSRVRYKEMLTDMQQGVKLLQRILEEDDLQEETKDSNRGIGEGSDMEALASQMKDILDKFEKFSKDTPEKKKSIDKVKHTSAEIANSTVVDSQNASASAACNTYTNAEANVNPVDECEHTSNAGKVYIPKTSLNNKKIIRDYAEAIKITKDNVKDIYYANDCIDMIQKWFSIRFNQATSPNFRYNIKDIPKWIENIVIVYGTAFQESEQKLQEFKSDFYIWLEKAKRGENNYAVPYIVNSVDVGGFIDNPKNSSLGYSMWTLLFDKGLSLLEDCDIPIDRSEIFNRIYSKEPNQEVKGYHHMYFDSKYNKAILPMLSTKKG